MNVSNINREPSKLKLWGARLRYQAAVFSLYHRRRASYFGFKHNLIQTIIMFFGTSAFFTSFVTTNSRGLFGYTGSEIYGFAGIVVALFALLDLIFKYQELSMSHAYLARQCGTILKELRAFDQSEESLTKVESSMADIFTDEPTQRKKYVEFTAHNETLISHGLTGKNVDCLVKFSVIQKFVSCLFKQWFNFLAPDLKNVKKLKSDPLLYVELFPVSIKSAMLES